MRYLSIGALALAAAALSGCYTEPQVTVNTPPSTAVLGAPPATTIVTPAPAAGATVVVPAR
jgi:hypothetical protein